MRLSLLILLGLLLATVAVSQDTADRCPSIRFLNTSSFYSDTGILALFRAQNELEMIDCFPEPCSPLAKEKQRQSIVQPVLDQIEKFKYELQIVNSVAILDGVKLEEHSQLLAIDREVDITAEFITLFNDRPSGGNRLQNASRASMFATIDFARTAASFSVTVDSNGDLGTCSPRSKCDELYSAMELYRRSKGFSLILNSNQAIPEGFSSCQIFNATDEFIKNFN